ncbi:class I SAM-dependent methyltransferase [Candidatus Woesearchaeota archaeon]|nr:class I SAM-dependent methyltransferase [Candidatus Woesearchaeota archaeon]
MDTETEFLTGMMELHFGGKVKGQLQKIAKKVAWAKGWPIRKEAFWNAEAFMWRHKIDKKVRQAIEKEFSFLRAGYNLDLGCGAYSYVPSVGFDVSEKMLLFNEQCYEKVQGDIEKKLPFRDGEFDSVTAVFILNYVQNVRELLGEIKRILKPQGVLMAVLSSCGINGWQKQKEVHEFSKREWKKVLLDAGFVVRSHEKEKLWFFRCEKEQ